MDTFMQRFLRRADSVRGKESAAWTNGGRTRWQLIWEAVAEEVEPGGLEHAGAGWGEAREGSESGTSSDRDSPRAWAAGGRLKMGEQILLAHELNCNKSMMNADQLQGIIAFDANVIQDLRGEILNEDQNQAICQTISSVSFLEDCGSVTPDEIEADTSLEKNNQDFLNHLLKKACAQRDVIIQVCKVLELCKSSTFSASEERVESERFLLLANQRLKAILKEVDHAKSGGPDRRESLSRGTLTLTDITVPLRGEFVNAAKTEAVSFWFVCLAFHGESVVPTRATCELGTGALYFSGPLCLSDLDEHFKLVLNIYSLRLKKVKPQFKKKYKIKKCKLLSIRVKQNVTKKVSLPPCYISHCSSFTLVGSLELDAANMKCRSWQLTKVTDASPLAGTAHVRTEPALRSVEASRSGPLSVLEEAAGGTRLWQHRWCRLRGWLFCFWGYPSEKHLGKPPLGRVDLRLCVGEVGPAPRELCSRPHAFLVETRPGTPASRPSGGQRHIFAADSKRQLEEWCELLNRVVASLRLWNALEA
ncbi:anillin-like isoform X2 [Bacillus rossius redtenbacheri]|uniref:anillin-like isoform X2 n=1 Tax=Bacillus rossius redtenbacheri TaxID=93214 RepID=UPI002FDD7212